MKIETYERARRHYQNWRRRGEGRAYIAILFSMCEGICPRCGKKMWLAYGDLDYFPRHSRATLDHIEELKFQKTHDKTNLAVCCEECNQKKNTDLYKPRWNATTRNVGPVFEKEASTTASEAKVVLEEKGVK